MASEIGVYGFSAHKSAVVGSDWRSGNSKSHACLSTERFKGVKITSNPSKTARHFIHRQTEIHG